MILSRSEFVLGCVFDFFLKMLNLSRPYVVEAISMSTENLLFLIRNTIEYHGHPEHRN